MAKKPTNNYKRFEVVFSSIHGQCTGNAISNPYAYISAKDEDEAKKFALEDMTAQTWSDIQVSWPDEENEIDDGVYEYSFGFSMKGKHGEYGGCVIATGESDSDARDKVMQDLEESGLALQSSHPFISITEMR